MANMATNEGVKPTETPVEDGQGTEEQPYLGTWKTREAAEEGFMNMKKLLDQQGNELGMLRKQTEFFMKNQQQPKAEPKQEDQPQATDYGKELKAIQKQMQDLDPDEPDYHRQLSKLVMQSNQISAEVATQKALSAAQSEFKKALDDRDVQTMHKKFYEQNPDFKTPEMQMRIQQYLENDQTGMSDPVVAYREIQRDDAMARLAEKEAALAEKERLLQLKAGADSTGKVISKGQSPNPPTKQPKVRGADLDRGMMQILNNMGVS